MFTVPYIIIAHCVAFTSSMKFPKNPTKDDNKLGAKKNGGWEK